MTELVACVGAENQAVKRIIQTGEWSKVILVGPQKAQQQFRQHQYIMVPKQLSLKDTVGFLQAQLDLQGPDVGVHFLAGSGKNHMALLAALLKLGMGIRLVAADREVYEL